MKPCSRLGDYQSGHQCFAPTPAIRGSSNVKCNGKDVLTIGSDFVPHACPKPHPVKSVSGSSSVFVNGKSVSRLGDRTGCGATIIMGSGNVLIGG